MMAWLMPLGGRFGEEHGVGDVGRRLPIVVASKMCAVFHAGGAGRVSQWRTASGSLRVASCVWLVGRSAALCVRDFSVPHSYMQVPNGTVTGILLSFRIPPSLWILPLLEQGTDVPPLSRLTTRRATTLKWRLLRLPTVSGSRPAALSLSVHT